MIPLLVSDALVVPTNVVSVKVWPGIPLGLVMPMLCEFVLSVVADLPPYQCVAIPVASHEGE